MKNSWMLYVVGAGALGPAEGLLTNFVAKLRDAGLTINNVQAIDGENHTDLAHAESGEAGWTMYVYGDGDVSKAYSLFPDFLNEFKSEGLQLQNNGIVVGTLRDIPIPA